MISEITIKVKNSERHIIIKDKEEQIDRKRIIVVSHSNNVEAVKICEENLKRIQSVRG